MVRGPGSTITHIRGRATWRRRRRACKGGGPTGRTQGETPPRGGGQQPVIGEQQQTQVVAAGSPQAATLPDELMMTVPYAFLRSAAAAKDTKVKSQTLGGKKYTVVTVTALNKAPASGYLNEQNVLERVETKIDNTVLGDIPYETTYSD